MRIRRIISTRAGNDHVVRVEQVVTPAAKHVVAARSANDPVVAQIAEQDIVAVTKRAPDVDAFRMVEIEEEPGNLVERLRLVVRRELAGTQSAVTEDIARVAGVVEAEVQDDAVATVGIRARTIKNSKPAGDGFGTRHRVVARAAVDEVVAETAEDAEDRKQADDQQRGQLNQ